VGYYAPALAVTAAMAIVPSAVSTYVYPRMSYALGQGRRVDAVRRMAFRASLVTLLIAVPVAVIGWMAAPYAVARFFPRYVPSIEAVRWALLAGLLSSVSPAVQALGSLKAWRALTIYVAVLLAARWVFPWMLSRGSDVLGGVALGNVWAAAVSGAVALFLVACASGRTEAPRPA